MQKVALLEKHFEIDTQITHPEVAKDGVGLNISVNCYTDECTNPRSANEVNESPAIIIWSLSGMPRVFPAAANCLVTATSSWLGSGFPDG